EFRKSVLPLDVIDISVTVQSHVNATATLKLYDRLDFNDYALKDTITYDVKEGVNSGIKFKDFSFGTPGLHTVKVELTGFNSDQIEENNVYYSYVNIETDKNILIIDGDGAQGEKMSALLTEMGYRATVMRPDAGDLPKNASELTRYNEVILMNVALATTNKSARLPAGYDKVLESYVGNYGGGLLTTGGEDTYYYGEMDGTAFDSFLPVNVIPEENEKSAIMFMIDASGSMYYDANSSSTSTYYEGSSKYESTRMYYAKQALTNAAMNIFAKKDYIGIMHFGKNSPGVVTDIGLTPATQRGAIRNAVNSISTIEGSRFQPAFDQAVQQLRDTSYKVDKKHIILVTDSDQAHATDTFSTLKANIAAYKENYNITVSVIAIKSDMKNDLRDMTTAVDKMGNLRFYDVSTADEIYQAITDECKAATTETINVSDTGYDTFVSAITPATSGVYVLGEDFPQGGVLPKISQYNGFTTKTGVVEALSAYNEENGNYDALYAAWTYGKGHVGSFASDLSHWAADFYTD
ncbi:MAG: VWA domain-containing protein, partial [Clostridia bacterium]|nr:VWA domain-containing protein [Clostridia bacterium]